MTLVVVRLSCILYMDCLVYIQPLRLSGTSDPFIAEECLKVVKSVISLFFMSDVEKVKCVNHVLKGDA